MPSIAQHETDSQDFVKGNLFVQKHLTKYASDRGSAIVVIESKNPSFPSAIEELQGTDARHLAIGFAAASGVPDPRINGNVVGPYAVNSQGKSLEDVRAPDGSALSPRDPLKQPASYRLDVKVCRKMG